MTNTSRRALSGIISGVLGASALTAIAQDPAKPANDPAAAATDLLKAPENVAKAPEDAEKSESGLASVVLKKGTGTDKPKATDTVTVHYTGWKASDGEMFDSSVKRGQPSSFPLNGVIAGWTEGLQLMVEGEKRRFWIPSDLAYGDSGRVAGDLTFDVELISIEKGPETPEAPENLTAPDDAEKTESGLASKVLKEGEGDASPAITDVVTFQFAGWDTTGKFLADSSKAPKPPEDRLRTMSIKGWAEGFQLMKKGEKRRLWVPAALAFGENPPPGAPQGDLIFDLELVDFKPVEKSADAPENLSAPEDAEKTESGLAFKVLSEGGGEGTPKDGDVAVINFTGWDVDGVTVGTSKQSPKPFEVSLDQPQIQGWAEALKAMKVGEKRRVWIPEDQAFGKDAGPGAPAGDLVFDLELVSFKTPPPPPAVPEDVAAAPEDAKKTDSGLKYKTLKEAPEGQVITSADRVKVHYTGWTTDGKMFDSSVTRDQPFEVNLRGGVIQGWLEGIKLMKEGEKSRFWIPADLAYGETPQRPGAPAGELVFDIEVLEVIKPKPKPKIEATTPPIRVEPMPKKEEVEEKPMEEKPAE